MALVTARHPASCGLKAARAGAALAGCLMLGACAQGGLSASQLLASAGSAPGKAADARDGRSELIRATEYWGGEYAKRPRELQPALNYARNLRALGEKQRALAVLQQASIFHGQSRELASEYGRLALELDQVGVASRLLAVADDPLNPDWRVISARGTALAKQGKYRDAVPYYERALTLAHDHPSILSNLALAYAMSGEPARAEGLLRHAAAVRQTAQNAQRIRQNLALVLGLQGKYEEAKVLASHDLAPDKAAENAEYLRRVVKLEPKASPASATRLAQAGAGAETPEAGERPATPVQGTDVPLRPAAAGKQSPSGKAQAAPEADAPPQPDWSMDVGELDEAWMPQVALSAAPAGNAP